MASLLSIFLSTRTNMLQQMISNEVDDLRDKCKIYLMPPPSPLRHNKMFLVLQQSASKVSAVAW